MLIQIIQNNECVNSTTNMQKQFKRALRQHRVMEMFNSDYKKAIGKKSSNNVFGFLATHELLKMFENKFIATGIGLNTLFVLLGIASTAFFDLNFITNAIHLSVMSGTQIGLAVAFFAYIGGFIDYLVNKCIRYFCKKVTNFEYNSDSESDDSDSESDNSDSESESINYEL